MKSLLEFGMPRVAVAALVAVGVTGSADEHRPS